MVFKEQVNDHLPTFQELFEAIPVVLVLPSGEHDVTAQQGLPHVTVSYRPETHASTTVRKTTQKHIHNNLRHQQQ